MFSIVNVVIHQGSVLGPFLILNVNNPSEKGEISLKGRPIYSWLGVRAGGELTLFNSPGHFSGELLSYRRRARPKTLTLPITHQLL